MSQSGHDGSVKIKAELDIEQYKKDLSDLAKQTEGMIRSGSVGYDKLTAAMQRNAAILERLASLEKSRAINAKASSGFSALFAQESRIASSSKSMSTFAGSLGKVLTSSKVLMPILKGLFRSLIPGGVVVAGLTAAFGFLTGKQDDAGKSSYRFSASLDGVYGSAEEAAKGVNKLRQEIALMGQEEAIYSLGKMKDQLQELRKEGERFKKADDIDVTGLSGRTGGLTKAEAEMNRFIDLAKAGEVSAEDFRKAMYAARNEKVIDDKELDKQLAWGERIITNTTAIEQLEARAAGAGSAISQALREIDEAAKPQGIKEAYAVYNRYVDAQNKGKTTATEAAKQTAKLAVERMKEASVAQAAAAATLSYAAAQARAANNEELAAKHSARSQQAMEDSIRLIADAQKLEAAIPHIKIGGTSSAQKDLISLADYMKKFNAEMESMKGTPGADFTKGLNDGLKQLENNLKNVKGVTPEVTNALKKQFTEAFAAGKVREFVDELDRLEGNGYEVALRKAADTAKEFETALLAQGATTEHAAASAERLKEALAHEVKMQDLQEQLSFMKETAELSGDYGLAIEKQNLLIEEQAKRYRTLFEGKPELLELVDIWEKLQKLQTDPSFEAGIERSAKKFIAEWSNAGKVAEKQFDMVLGAVQELGSVAIDAIFDDADFRADQFLKNLAKQIMQMMMNRMIASAFTMMGFSEGGYTGDVPVNQAAGVVHGQEYVLNAKATKAIGVDTLNALNTSRSAADVMASIPSRMRARDAVVAGATSVVYAPNISLDYSAPQSSTPQADAQRMAEILNSQLQKSFNSLIDQRLINQSRPGGLLNQGIR